MDDAVVEQDKVLGATYGFILANALTNKPSSQYVRYSRHIKLESNFYNLQQVDRFFDFYKTLSNGRSFITDFPINPINGLISGILQYENDFKNILPCVTAYSLLNANNNSKRAFSDLSVLVYSSNFSDNLLCASFSVHLILQNLLNGTGSDKVKILDDVKAVIFRELKGLTTYNDVFYENVSDRDLYRLSKESNVWNNMLISYGVLKASDDYLEGVKKIILLGGNDISLNIQLFGLFFGSLYGVSYIPSGYVSQIDNILPVRNTFCKPYQTLERNFTTNL